MNKDAVFLSRVREARGDMSQMAFAKIIGVSQVTLSRIETGRNEPDIDAIKALCRSGNVSADWLLGLSDDPSPRRAPVALEGGETGRKLPPIKEVFPARFREVTARISKGSVSEDCGLSLGDLDGFLKGTAIPRLEAFRNICASLGVNPAFLLGLSDDPQTAAGAPGTGQGGEFARSEEVSSLRDEVRALRAAVERLGRK